MKIILTDNFGREEVSDTLIAENVPEFWAPSLVELLNKHYSSGLSPYWFRMVADNAKLYVYDPR